MPGVEDWHAATLDAARPEAVAYQHERGKLTARERIAALVDSGSFAELGGLVRPEEPGEDGRPVVADGMVTGPGDDRGAARGGDLGRLHRQWREQRPARAGQDRPDHRHRRNGRLSGGVPP